MGVPREVAVRRTSGAGRRRSAAARSPTCATSGGSEEGWWTRTPLRRRYFDLVLADGRNAVVFLDRRRARWYAQRA